jgi:hypothetical protein
VAAKKTDRRGAPRIAGLILGVAVFTVFMGVISWLVLSPVVSLAIQAQKWSETPCRIEESKLTRAYRKGTGGRGSPRLHLVYSYNVGGKDYLSKRYAIMDGFLTGEFGINSVLKRHPVGTETRCYVNPENPSESLLHRGFRMFMLLPVVPLLFFLLGVLF